MSLRDVTHIPHSGEQRSPGWRLSLISLFLLLAGCMDSSLPAATDGSAKPPGPGPAVSRYSLANGCHVLKSMNSGAYLRREADGHYSATAPREAAEPFYLKPTELGQYLFYTASSSYMAGDGTAPVTATVAGAAAEWRVDMPAPQLFVLDLAGRRLSTNSQGALVLSDQQSADKTTYFRIENARGCAEYPEIALNATGPTFAGKRSNGEVLGFADSHNHITGLQGFGGTYGYGWPFHRYGVEHALHDCAEHHGTDGLLAIEDHFVSSGVPVGKHDTVGWPTFKDWPRWNSPAHQHLYYRWIERGWLAGLRLMVSHVQENQMLCTLQRQVGQSCNEMESSRMQIRQLRAMQDYVDAQAGGPGRGWFRIVTDSAQARRVIEDGKLAVIIGIETSNLFDCSVSFPLPGIEIRGCDARSFDTQLEEFHALGVRAVFPMHEFNNALGGNGIFGGMTSTILNLANRGQTGEFWRTYACPDENYFYAAGSLMTGIPAPDNPLNQLLQGPLPAYDPSYRHCNTRSITDLGRYAIQRLMERSMLIEIDHMEYAMKTQVIEMAEARKSPYPLMSGHGGHGGISMDQARRIFALGGLIFDYQFSSRDHVSRLNSTRKTQALAAATRPGLYFGFGFGQDANGLSTLAPPRSGEKIKPVRYPFKLFSGPDWGEEFAGIKPVEFAQQVSGERIYDIGVDGMAHYGLIPDWVEEVRIEGGAPAIRDLFRSAEAYLQMWERAEGRR
ncbi:MAG: hypothetical protein V4688_00735 [Pseudomonadota bacterium]